MQTQKFETFNDGIIEICEVKNRTIVATKMSNIRYGKRVVGITRFYKAKIASDSVDKVVSILPVPGIQRQDICIIGHEQFKILQIQDKFDKCPPCLYLSLERIATKYKDERNEQENKD